MVSVFKLKSNWSISVCDCSLLHMKHCNHAARIESNRKEKSDFTIKFYYKQSADFYLFQIN